MIWSGGFIMDIEKGFKDTSIHLSAADEDCLRTIDAKFQLIRDQVAAVALGLSSGAYMFGPGGCGKSYAVIDELRRRNVPYKLYDSRMTGRGLYNALEKFPDAVHLLEDMEQLFRDTGARGVLRSALWSQTPSIEGRRPERLVTWSTHQMEHSTIFTGGIVMTANRPLPDLPELDAVKTRIAYTQVALSDQEMIALMRRLCLDGQATGAGHVSPAECREVCDYIVDQCGGLNRRFDLRLYVNAVGDYAQWRDVESGCHWHDLVAARIKERPIAIGSVATTADRQTTKTHELELAQKLMAITDREERSRRWHEQTGKSEPTLYRRLDEVKKKLTHGVDN